ncbi:MAG: DUF2141 domain-containing protein [Pseudomonadota bacterium]
MTRTYLKPCGVLSAAALALVLGACAGGVDTTDMPVEQLDIRDHERADTCDGDARQVRVTVPNVTAGGILTVEVYGRDPDDFLETAGRVRRVRVAAEEGPQTVCQGIDEDGPFGVAIYHDQNGNRTMDRNFIGIPREPFGLSNNPRLRLARPKFEDSRFDLPDDGVDLEVELQRY